MAYRSNFRFDQGMALGPLGFIIIANLFVFLATFFRPQLIPFLALSGLTIADQPWTMLTSMFTHANFGHIFANMLTLFFYGSYLVNLVGEKRFALVYFLGGLLGNAIFLALAPHDFVIGASGAVFAIGGALVVLRPKLPVFFIFFPFPVPLWVAILLGLVAISPGVAWQAHFGGFLFGLMGGYYFRMRPSLRF